MREAAEGKSAAPAVVAIDGPSGVGKSTVARILAQRLGVPYLDTGAMYRTLAVKVLDLAVDPADQEAVETVAREADLRVEPGPGSGLVILLDGQSVEERIRTPEVSEVTSTIAAYGGVRRRLVALQRDCGARHGAVVEGRDIGTRVFPGTPHKFFLDAAPEVRHRRRFEQLRQAGEEIRLEEVEEAMEQRDRRDSGRSDSPLTCDPSYLRIDTGDQTPAEIVDMMEQAIHEDAGLEQDAGKGAS